MREQALPIVIADSHLSLDKVGHVPIVIDTSGAKSCASFRRVSSRDEDQLKGLLQQGLSAAIARTVTLNDRYEPSVRNAVHQEVLQNVKVPDIVCATHDIAFVARLYLLELVALLDAQTKVGVVREVEACRARPTAVEKTQERLYEAA